jgi:hypothetical protein
MHVAREELAAAFVDTAIAQLDGMHTPTDTILRLEDLKGASCLCEALRRRQTRGPSADYHYIQPIRHLSVSPQKSAA